MDLEFGPEYDEFREEVRSFIKANEEVNLVGKSLRSSARVEWQQKLIDNGYFARSTPKEYGVFGGDIDILKTRIIAEEFAKSSIPKPLGGQGIQMLVPTLLELGTEEQKKAYVKPTLRGEIIWCQGYSEPNSGSDLASLQTKGELDGDEWVINGQKTWTSTAKFAQMCFCLVRTESDAPKHQGISYLLIPMDTAGIEIRPIMQMTGDADFNEVFFTDVRIPATNIVGKRGEGWKVANATLTHERGSLADPDVIQNRLYALIDLMKSETIDGERVIDKPVFRDRLLRVQGKVLAQQANALRLLSSSINKKEKIS